MHDTKIEMKLEEETKKLSEICEKLVDAAKMEIESGIQNVDTEEFGKVIDAIKDLCDAKEKIAKKCYYATILKAMEKSEEEDKEEEKFYLRMMKEENKDEYKRMKEEYGEDEGERRFYDNYRYKSSGRFAPTGRGSYMPRSSGRRGRRGYEEMPYMMIPEMCDPEYYRDMDRMSGKMYYSGSSNSGGSYGGNSGGNSYSGNSGSNSRGYSGGGSSSGGNGGSNGGGSSRSYTEGYNDGEENGYQRGYSEGNRDGRRNNGGNNSRYDRAKRGFEETKQAHSGNTPEDKQITMKEAEKFVNVFMDGLEEALEDSPVEVKNMVKSKVTGRMQKMQ